MLLLRIKINMQWIGTDKYYSENQYWFARWNCILYYSVVLLEPSVAKKRGLAGDTETEEDLTPLRKRVSFFLTSSFCFFFNVFYWWRQRPNPEVETGDKYNFFFDFILSYRNNSQFSFRKCSQPVACAKNHCLRGLCPREPEAKF